MIGWIFTIINVLIIIYYIRFTYIHYNGGEIEKLKFPVWTIALAIISCFVPILNYIMTGILIIAVPLVILFYNMETYDEIEVKGFLNKKI